MNSSLDDLIDNLSIFLKNRRKLLGLSQEQLAVKSGISLTLIRDIERKAANPTLSTLVKIADVFDMHVAELLDFSTELRAPQRISKNILQELRLLPPEKLALMLEFIRIATK